MINKIVFSFILFTFPIGAIDLPDLSFQEKVITQENIVLTGFDLSIENVVAITDGSAEVSIDPSSWKRVARSHELLLQAAKEDKPVYGLNRGVGLNKDKNIFDGNLLTREAKAASIEFNRNNLYATSAAEGPPIPIHIVRAIMLVKLNSMLQGSTGVQPKAARLIYEFLQNDIQPVIPGRGSIGEADITILSHLGLALMGEGEVYYKGEKMSAKEAMDQAGLKPLVPYAKDSLSIMSSNAYSVTLGALLIHDAEKLMDKADLIFALSLEGLDGNIAPFLKEVQNLRPYKGQKKSAANIRQALKGSSLWKKSETRALQDPLSFRSISQVHGTARDQIENVKSKILLHLNSSDDNPVVVLEPKQKPSSEQEASYYLKDGSGAVIPTANFETINWAIDFESLGISLSHVSRMSTQRMLHLSSEKITHLTRFLSPDEKAIVFGAIQKTFHSLDTEIRSLSQPVSQDFFPVAGGIEDHASNSPMILKRLCMILDRLQSIMGIEMMHNTQALDLRLSMYPDFEMGEITQKIYKDYRSYVPFIEKDRPLSNDIKVSHDYLARHWSSQIVTPDCVFKQKEK